MVSGSVKLHVARAGALAIPAGMGDSEARSIAAVSCLTQANARANASRELRLIAPRPG